MAKKTKRIYVVEIRENGRNIRTDVFRKLKTVSDFTLTMLKMSNVENCLPVKITDGISKYEFIDNDSGRLVTIRIERTILQ